jgi:hypothetical protein
MGRVTQPVPVTHASCPRISAPPDHIGEAGVSGLGT